MSDKPDLPPLPAWVEAMLPGASPAASPGEVQATGPESPPESSAAHPALTPVKSSNISGIAHDGQSLWVKFLNGTLYRYPTAGADLHTGMLTAESAGQYFHKHIKSAHKGERVS